jgi:hypothetical protein
MRLFPVPYSITEEEKIFGGYLSLRQILYLVVASVAFLIVFGAARLPLAFRLFFGLLLLGAGASFAFLKISNVGLDSYVKFAALFLFRQKRYCLVRREGGR